MALIKPIFVTISAFFILSEQITPALIVAMILVSFGVLFINHTKKTTVATQIPPVEVTNDREATF